MDAAKLFALIFVGYLAIEVGLSGKLGSILGCVIDPSALQEGATTSTTPTTLSYITSSTPTSGVLTPTQIKQYAQAAGFTGQNLTLAVAIALAESGGNTSATDYDSNGSVDRGLWQINSVHTQFAASQLFQPLYNAKAAYQISGGSNFNPWVTFTTGAYLAQLGRAQGA